jgi:hypothetical protein
MCPEQQNQTEAKNSKIQDQTLLDSLPLLSDIGMQANQKGPDILPIYF